MFQYENIRTAGGNPPDTWLQFFAYPVTMALGTANVSEVFFVDVRYLALLLVAVALIAISVARWALGGVAPGGSAHQVAMLCATLVLAYAMWRTSTSVQRYFIVEDVLASVLLVWLVLQFPRVLVLPLLALVVAVHLITVRIPDWGHVQYGASEVLPLGGVGGRLDDAQVFLGDIPMGYAVASFGPRARFVLVLPAAGPMQAATDATSGFAGRVRALIDRDWKEGIWLVSRPDREAPDAYFRGYNLVETNDCRDLQTHAERLRICRLERGVAIQ